MNRAQVKGGQYDEISKMRIQIEKCLANSTKSKALEVRDEIDKEAQKRMMFFANRRDILKELRKESLDAALAINLKLKRANKWNKLMQLTLVGRVLLREKLDLIKQYIEKRKRARISILYLQVKLRMHYKKKAPTFEERNRLEIR